MVVVEEEGEWRVMRGEEGGDGDCRERADDAVADSEGEWRVMMGEEGGEGDCRERTDYAVVDTEGEWRLMMGEDRGGEDTVESMEDVGERGECCEGEGAACDR